MRAFSPAKTEDKTPAKGSARAPGATLPDIKLSGYSAPTIFRKASCACGGECPSCQANSSDLKVSQPNDAAEIEADAVADRVMRTQTTTDSIHHKCDGREEEVKGKIQRKPLPSAGGVPSQSPAHVQTAIGSGGQPLDRQTRNFFEPRMGYDLSSVRIHTDSIAGESARAIDAMAYTLGSNIVFGEGQYEPETVHGQRLLAHELAHVVQQRNGSENGIFLKKHVFTPGRPAHDHSPGHWPAVQAQAAKDCDLVAWIDCICARSSPEVVVALALAVEMDGKPLAKEHLTHYLTGGGKEFNEDANLERLIKTDEAVREKLLREIAKSPTGHVFIEQSDYTDQDFRLAFGGIDRMEWEVDTAAGTVDIWFQDRYDFHPVGFGYTKFSDGADVVRSTNCVHAAAVELKPGAADFWMKGQASFPLTKPKGSPGGNGSDDL